MTEPAPEADAGAKPLLVSFKKRGARPKGNIRKRPASPPPKRADDSSSDSSSEDESLQGPKAKRRNKATTVTAASDTTKASSSSQLFATTFEADRTAPIADSNDATKRIDWYDEPNAKIGPARPSTNVRITTQMDFAPDVCKDYKKTGFCGYGDNCIYAHIRGDFEHGWQLDQSWEKISKGKSMKGTVVASANREAKRDSENTDEMAMLEKIPFACIICEGPYRQPVVTRCGHYFCEPCALKRYRKDPTCKACSAATNGVFNTASTLNKLLDRKREREAKKKEEEAEAEAET